MLPFPQHPRVVSNSAQYLEVTLIIQQSHHLGDKKQLGHPYSEAHLPPKEVKLLAPSPSNIECNHVSRGCVLLLLLATTMVIVIITGIIFVAHQAYISFGGQGFLKARSENESSTIHEPAELYLPLRVMDTFHNQSYLTKKAPGNIPFYTCGDQQYSCEAYGQPVGFQLSESA